jgi:hypothetical protein
MKKFWNTFVVWLLANYMHYYVQADVKEKCPCCGIRQLHPMRYDTDSKRLLHMCRTLHAGEKQTFGCGAIWNTSCLVDPGRWETIISSVDENGRQEVKQPEAKFHSEASREPTIIRSKQEKAS